MQDHFFFTQTRFKPTHFVRWQQTSAPGGGGTSATKVLLYGVTGTGVCAAATVAYANYDPAFKNRVNEYVPGFGKLSDFVADKWVSISGPNRQKGSSDVAGLGSRKQEVVFLSLRRGVVIIILCVCVCVWDIL